MDLCTVKATFERMDNSKISAVKSFVEKNGGAFKRWPVKHMPSVCSCEVKFYKLGFMANRELPFIK